MANVLWPLPNTTTWVEILRRGFLFHKNRFGFGTSMFEFAAASEIRQALGMGMAAASAA